MPAQFVQHSHPGDEREQHRVEGRKQVDLISRFAREPGEVFLAVAAVMVMRDIVRAPHPRVGRDGEEQRTARFEASKNSGQRALVVDDMLQHIEQGDEIVTVGREA